MIFFISRGRLVPAFAFTHKLPFDYNYLLFRWGIKGFRSGIRRLPFLWYICVPSEWILCITLIWREFLISTIIIWISIILSPFHWIHIIIGGTDYKLLISFLPHLKNQAGICKQIDIQKNPEKLMATFDSSTPMACKLTLSELCSNFLWGLHKIK